jgi:hypothetical protein
MECQRRFSYPERSGSCSFSNGQYSRLSDQETRALNQKFEAKNGQNALPASVNSDTLITRNGDSIYYKQQELVSLEPYLKKVEEFEDNSLLLLSADGSCWISSYAPPTYDISNVAQYDMLGQLALIGKDGTSYNINQQLKVHDIDDGW